MKILSFIGWLIIFILKTITLDLAKNIKKAYIYGFRPGERDKIKRKLETKKIVKLLQERLERTERLIYSIFKDPKYSNSNRGKNDLKELKKEIK